MIPKESIITPQITKQREERHRRLMRMIKHFKRTNEEVNKLERIKQNTVLEINIRFLRSQHNKSFIFPKLEPDSSDEEEKQTNPFSSRASQYYDLHAQNQITGHTNQIGGKLNESARRVKSLDREKNDIESERLGRFQQTKGVYSYKKLRKKSAVEPKKVLSAIKLPELNKKQNVKSELKNQSLELEKVVGKKLLTETNSPKKYDLVTTMSSKELNKQLSKSKRKLDSLKKLH